MKNFKIKNKFITTFAVILTFFIIAAITAIVSLQNVSSNFDFFYNESYKVSSTVMEMRTSIQTAAKSIGYATMVEDPAQTKKFIDECEAELQKIKSNVDVLYEIFPSQTQLIDEFKQIMNDGVVHKEKVFVYALAGDNKNAISLYFTEYMPRLKNGSAQLNEMNDIAKKDANSAYNNSNQTKSVAFMLLIAIICITLAITVLLAVYLTKSFTKPILEIEKAANEIAGGNLDALVSYQSKDELGNLTGSMRQLTSTIKGIIDDVGMVLAALGDGDFTADSKTPELYVGKFSKVLDSMHLIITHLTQTLTQIGQSSDQVSSGSDQVASGAQALSQGATEQASSIEELSATIAELSGQVKQNAENARKARSQSEGAAKEVETSNVRMQEMVEAMNDINSKSAQIGKIIKTIEDIAFQTNILALNAAVEAARAGAAGKGFAVVADEVRNLAGKSAAAAKDTTALIEETINAVGNGTRIAHETEKSMLGVVSGTQAVTNLVAEISEASSNQATAITQVTAGLDQISAVVQTNSATAEESAAASEELSGQAQMLKEAVGKFTLSHKQGQEASAMQYAASEQYLSGQYASASTDKY